MRNNLAIFFITILTIASFISCDSSSGSNRGIDQQVTVASNESDQTGKFQTVLNDLNTVEPETPLANDPIQDEEENSNTTDEKREDLNINTDIIALNDVEEAAQDDNSNNSFNEESNEDSKTAEKSNTPIVNNPTENSNDFTFTSVNDALLALGFEIPQNDQFAKNFTLNDVNGNPVTFSETDADLHLVNFWYYACNESAVELPTIKNLNNTFKNDGLNVHTVAFGGNQQGVKYLVDTHGYDFKVVVDQDKSVTNSYGVTRGPVTFLVDSKGKIIGTHSGAVNWDAPKNVAAIEYLLSELKKQKVNNWKPFTWYKLGDKIKFGKFEYICRIGHYSLPGWKPSILPALWYIPNTFEKWHVQVKYKVGDRVLFQNRSYKCRIGHVALPSWQPSKTPALWVKE